MRKAYLASKSLGLKLLKSVDLEGALILHPDDSDDCRSIMPEFEKLGARIVSNRAEAAEALREFRPDIALVCGWYWLISEEIRTLAPRGFFGIHNSLLPKYRGGAPLVWAIIHGEEEVGSTLFRLDSGIDDGPIAHQVRLKFPRTATIADAIATIEAEWAAVFPSLWSRLCEGTLALRPQQGEPSRFPNRKPAEGLIDWTLPAARVHDFIRAQSAPYPGAFSEGVMFERSFEHDGHGVAMICGDGNTIRVVARDQVVAI